ncbi:MAG TPA: glycosyltransferase [Solirubrobacteraceae bacterium]|nr:glycosyltransferase [Solirubrobacteraceae bacterium]
MRLLVTIPWAERLGGAEAMLQSIVDGVDPAADHEFTFVFFEQGSWAQELRAAGHDVEVLEAGRLRQLHRWARTVARLTRIFRSRQPDLILNWAAKTHLYGGPAAMLAGMSGRVLWWQQAIPMRGLSKERGLGIDTFATLLPAIAVGCYGSVAADAQQRMFPRRRTFVVHAGAPVPQPSEPGGDTEGRGGPLELPAELPVVGLVGRLQPWKGQDRLLRAQAILRDRGHRFHLVIVGGDSWGLSPEYSGSLAPLIEQLGLAGDVTMTGEVPDAGPYIEQMDVLVNASDPEPFGIVLLEAMARGVPVVAVDSGGPGEFLIDGQTASLARSGAPEALADALEPMLASAQNRAEFARAGLDLYMREFTDGALSKRFFERLAELRA